jgi:hypothetical protein
MYLKSVLLKVHRNCFLTYWHLLALIGIADLPTNARTQSLVSGVVLQFDRQPLVVLAQTAPFFPYVVPVPTTTTMVVSTWMFASAKLLASYSSLLVTHCLSHYYRIYECKLSQGVVALYSFWLGKHS